MKHNIRSKGIALLLACASLLLALCGCGKPGETQTATTELTTQEQTTTTESITQEQVTQAPPDYWADKPVPQYAGWHREMEQLGGTLIEEKLAATAKGEIYSLRFDLRMNERETPAAEQMDLGYFYVQENKILRAKRHEISEQEARAGKFPADATLVFQDKATKDPLGEDEKGDHEWISLGGALITYHYYNNRVETGYYENLVWQKGVGLVAYRSGFGARRDEIFVRFPHDIAAPVSGRQPLVPQRLTQEGSGWPSKSLAIYDSLTYTLAQEGEMLTFSKKIEACFYPPDAEGFRKLLAPRGVWFLALGDSSTAADDVFLLGKAAEVQVKDGDMFLRDMRIDPRMTNPGMDPYYQDLSRGAGVLESLQWQSLSQKELEGKVPEIYRQLLRLAIIPGIGQLSIVKLQNDTYLYSNCEGIGEDVFGQTTVIQRVDGEWRIAAMIDMKQPEGVGYHPAEE